MPGIVTPAVSTPPTSAASARPNSPSCATIAAGGSCERVSTTSLAHLAVRVAVVLEHDALDRRAAEVEAEVAAHRAVQPPSTVSTAPVTNGAVAR